MFVLLNFKLKKNKHEKNYFNNGSDYGSWIC
jgi:hypothetical protein